MNYKCQSTSIPSSFFFNTLKSFVILEKGYLPIKPGRPFISQKTEHLYNNTDYFNNGQNGPGASSWVLGFPRAYKALAKYTNKKNREATPKIPSYPGENIQIATLFLCWKESHRPFDQIQWASIFKFIWRRPRSNSLPLVIFSLFLFSINPLPDTLLLRTLEILKKPLTVNPVIGVVDRKRICIFFPGLFFFESGTEAAAGPFWWI